MDWGLIVTLAVGVGGAWLTYLGVSRKARTDERGAELDAIITTLRAEVERTTAALTSARTALEETTAENRALRDQVHKLTGQIRDRDEMLEDWRAIGEWITTGARPPAPTLTWRIREQIDHARALARQQPTTTESQED